MAGAFNCPRPLVCLPRKPVAQDAILHLIGLISRRGAFSGLDPSLFPQEMCNQPATRPNLAQHQRNEASRMIDSASSDRTIECKAKM